MELSRRIAAISPSPTVALNAKAKALQAEGADVLNFAVGEPDFQTPTPVVEEAIASLKRGNTKYGAAGGGLPLRKAICNKLERENRIKFQPDDVVVGIGAKEILFHIFLGILNEGDEVIVPAPYWVSYPEQIRAAGACPVYLPMPQNLAQMTLTPESLEAAATSKTRCIALNYPNNPAGYTLSTESLKSLGNYLKTKDWWIISDEIYEYMSFDQPHRSLLELVPELREKFILVNGLSKSFAMTGWRVGYCAAPQPVAKIVRSLQSHSSTCLPGFIEDGATKALNEGKELVTRDIAELKRRRDIALKCASSVPDLKFFTPEGAFYVFLDLRQILAGSSGRFAPTDSFKFAEWLLIEHHVAAIPGEAFGAPGFMRLSYAVPEQNIHAGFERLKKAITQICRA